MGSQIANIRDINVALKEAGQFYAELHRLGAPIKIVDAGGGLGWIMTAAAHAVNLPSITVWKNMHKHRPQFCRDLR